MIKVKGLYQWKLIDSKTGHIDEQGEQWNTVNDHITQYLGVSDNYSGWNFSQLYGQIQLSDSTPTVGKEYRKAGASSLDFNLLVTSSAIAPTVNTLLNSSHFEYNFGLPVSNLTINIIGLSFLYPYTNTQVSNPNFMSFIHLSTPISQSTSQYLYIKYTIFFAFNPSNNNIFTPSNDYITNLIRSNIMTGGTFAFGKDAILRVTPFLPPSANRLNFVARSCPSINDIPHSSYPTTFNTNETTYSIDIQRDYLTTDIPGPIGTVVWSGPGNCTNGYSPSNNVTPSISRVFVHPYNRTNQLFSDPGFPPQSNGILNVTGTPTVLNAIFIKARITTTGQANDTPNGYTGKFCLEAMPYGLSNMTGNTPTGTSKPLNQLFAGLDIDNNIMPDSPVIISGPSYDNIISSAIKGHAHIIDGNGNFIYSVQYNQTTLYNNICRWNYNTIESSEPLLKFGSTNTIVNCVLQIGSLIYIASNDGIYKYDPSTLPGAISLLTISGIISGSVTELVYDSVLNTLWSGHSTGICKIDLIGLTAIQYVNTTNTDALYSMSSDMINITAGQLSVSNGFMMRCGTINNTDVVAWVMQDAPSLANVNWVQLSFTDGIKSGCVVANTNNIISRGSLNIQLNTVVPSGKGIGTVMLLSSATAIYNGDYGTAYALGQMVQVSDTCFIDVVSVIISNYFADNMLVSEYFSITNSNVVQDGYNSIFDMGPYTHGTDNNSLSQTRNLINFNAVGLYQVPFWNYLFDTVTFAKPFRIGYNGSSWVKDSAGVYDRYISESPISIIDGLTIQFNNASGKTWDQQFIQDERFTFMYGPMVIKDNLQITQIKAKHYYCDARLHEDASSFVLSNDPVVIVSEKSDPDFRDIDTVDFLTVVHNTTADTYFTQHAISSVIGASFNITTANFLDVTELILDGTPIALTGSIPSQLLDQAITTYYVLNPTSSNSHVQLATTLSGTPITFDNSGSGTYYKLIPPSGQYIISKSRDRFVFNPSDINGISFKLTYTYTLYNT